MPMCLLQQETIHEAASFVAHSAVLNKHAHSVQGVFVGDVSPNSQNVAPLSMVRTSIVAGPEYILKQLAKEYKPDHN